jgi:hypothetical protein
MWRMQKVTKLLMAAARNSVTIAPSKLASMLLQAAVDDLSVTWNSHERE